MALGALRKQLGRLGLVLGALLGLLIWIAVAVLSTRSSWKLLWDFSPQAQYTVTDETERLLRELRERATTLAVDTFYTRLPRPSNELQAHQIGMIRRVQELTTQLLRTYASLGGEGVQIGSYELGDPGRTRKRVDELGIRGDTNVLPGSDFVVVSIGKRRKVLSLMLDLAVVDVPAARPVAAPGARQAFPSLEVYKGEEAVSSAIRSLIVEGSPKVYFLRGFGEAEILAGVGDSYSELLGALADEGFEVAQLDLEKTGRVPDDATVVALLEPRREMSEGASNALFAYLRRGGRMFLNVSFVELPQEWNPTFDFLGRLCGFEIGRDLVCHMVTDPANPEAGGVGGPMAQTLRIVDLPRTHPITRPLLANARYPQLKTAREVRARSGVAAPGVNVDASFLVTGKWGWIAPRLPSGEVDMSLPAVASAFDRRSVGILIDVDSNDPTRPGHLAIFGGVAFLNGAGFGINGDLALNTFQWMAERKELVTIRGNRYRAQKLELTPQQVDRTKRLLRLWVPGALLALGVVIFFARSRQ
jgi:hypothetical protein